MEWEPEWNEECTECAKREDHTICERPQNLEIRGLFFKPTEELANRLAEARARYAKEQLDKENAAR
jgi:hypothetical protein